MAQEIGYFVNTEKFKRMNDRAIKVLNFLNTRQPYKAICDTRIGKWVILTVFKAYIRRVCKLTIKQAL